VHGHRIISWADFEGKWLPYHGLVNGEVITNAIPPVKRLLHNKGIQLKNHKLPTVCALFKIPLRHHDSLSDALAVYHIANLTGVL